MAVNSFSVEGGEFPIDVGEHRLAASRRTVPNMDGDFRDVRVKIYCKNCAGEGHIHTMITDYSMRDVKMFIVGAFLQIDCHDSAVGCFDGGR